MDESEKVKNWLNAIGLGSIADRFLQNGYNTLEYCSNLTENDLDVIGIITSGTR